MSEKIKEYIEKYDSIWSESNKRILMCLYMNKNENEKYVITENVLMIIHPDNQMDEWPIYLSDDMNEYEYVGNFRQYVGNLLSEYGKKYENLQLLRKAQDDLKQFSKKCVSVSLWLYKDNLMNENENICKN